MSVKHTETSTNQGDYKREKMVGWYDPRQLLNTANEVLVSTILGKHADRRLVQALNPEKIQPYEYIKEFRISGSQETSSSGEWVERQEIWIDYVSDLGDGWDATYAVAHYLAQDGLAIEGEILPRAQVLIMGGDEVYPTATSDEYQNRLEHPYGAALQKNEGERPHLFAIPGNHDWYDSLASFTRIFCDKNYFPLFDEDALGDSFQPGKWYLPQQRSYFAIKLPHGYWLIGVDLQLSSDLDTQQIEYFREIAEKQMHAGDQIILCAPEPYWVYAAMYGDMKKTYRETRLSRGYLENKVFQDQKIVTYLAGDLHHYFRIQECPPDGTDVVRITAGGGGAFLHPTNGQLNTTYREKRDCSQFSFPTPAESQSLCWRNFLFPFFNWQFGILTALVYFLAAWSILAFLRFEGEVQNFIQALHISFRGSLETPIAALWGLIILGGFLMFTDTHSRWYRFAAGLTHGITHLICIFLIGWGSYFVTIACGMKYKEPDQFFSSAALILAGGWIVGSYIFGIYLFISLNVFGRHSNEAFSALAIPDYKNFLRLRINQDGLTIYPIGIRRVPRKWRQATSSDYTVSAIVPDDPKATPPFFIEKPIHLKRPQVGQA
ncbi:MAG: metallophosphoesterase [Blastocatellia bacterium]|nr:metallophosphoesterase [Blastocatellia bacterium]